MSSKQIEKKKAQVENAAVVTEGQLAHFFKRPSLSTLIALEQCLYSYIELHGELVEVSEKPEDLDFSKPETERIVVNGTQRAAEIAELFILDCRGHFEVVPLPEYKYEFSVRGPGLAKYLRVLAAR